MVGESRFCSSCGRPSNPDVMATQTVAIATPAAIRTADDGRFLPGATIAARYRIIALLGRGGMGEVYRADDLTLGQQVALKFLPPAVAENSKALERFRNEVRIARRVSHPNVCRVYDVGEVEGHVFLSMEYVDGEDLGSLLRRIGRLPEDKALEISRRLCAGLGAAHEKGVLHRDLKPANVMLDARGQVLLTDFGLAGLVDQIEGAEVRNGTPAYMAPEQLAGREVTVRSDLYSLGLVMYEILTGKRPFESDTLEGLERVRRETTLTNPSTLVKDLDPRVERVVMRCLDPDPQKRPTSALAVAAALPGGDPLAEALAAGETPSPDMVAAAGEGCTAGPRIATAIFVAILIGLIAQVFIARRLSALERMHLEYSPEVLNQKTHDLLLRLGYAERPGDEAWDLGWDGTFIGYAQAKGGFSWETLLNGPPSLLGFYYRHSDYPLVAGEFHDDKLTPGVVTQSEADGDPPAIMSGMVSVKLDAQGRLVSFRAIPPQVEAPPSAPRPFDWNLLFEAAQIDPKTLQPAEPEWTFLGTADQRAAWSGTWPATGWPLRVEAAAFHGKPVAFAMIGPWTSKSRMPPRDSTSRNQVTPFVLGLIGLALLATGSMLAWRNSKSGRSDRRGAFRLAYFIFGVQMLTWLLRAHLTASIGTFGNFLLAICTSVFWGSVIWTLYVALEPYARRHWPQALISWTDLLSGRYRDPIVGRDTLFGAALGMIWVLLDSAADTFAQARGSSLNFGNLGFLSGTRATLAVCVGQILVAIELALVCFFLLFVLRALLRNQWLAFAAFVLMWGIIKYFDNSASLAAIYGVESAIVFAIAAIVVMRFGFLSLAMGVFVDDLISGLQVPSNTSIWYFADSAAVLVGVAALAIWAYRVSLGGRKLFGSGLFA